jgi:uncharacterized membrane protein YkvA (DUF1232 family)
MTGLRKNLPNREGEMTSLLKANKKSREDDAAESSPEAQTGHQLSPELAAMTWEQQAQRIHTEAQMFYFAFKHPRVHWYAKLVAACTAGYLFSPIQLIPTFIPVIGLLDDFLVLFLGVKLLQRIIPPEILAECRELAEVTEMRRKDEVRSTAAVIAVLAVASVWLFAAIAGSALIASYMPLAIKR